MQATAIAFNGFGIHITRQQLRQIGMLILMLMAAVAAFSQTYTPNLGLTKPIPGQLNWAGMMNGNMDILDSWSANVQPTTIIGTGTSPVAVCSSVINKKAMFVGTDFSMWMCSNVTGSYAWHKMSADAVLPNVGTSGTCGDSTHFCTPTFDVNGRETAWTIQSIPSGFTAGTDLSGSSTNQTVIGLLGHSLGTIGVGYPHWNGSTFAWDTPSSAASGTGIPSNAYVIVTGDSRLWDDSIGSTNLLGPTTTATAASCNGSGLCAITDTQTYTAGQWVRLNGFSPSCLSGGSPSSTYFYGTGNQLYKILSSGLSGTSFQIQTQCASVSGTGGLIQDASYYVPVQLIRQQAFANITALYLRNGLDGGGAFGGVTGLVCEQSANFTQMFGDIITAAGSNPIVFIDEGGFNDIGVGTSEATLKACYQSFWSQAHAAGATVFQNTVIDGTWGLTNYDSTVSDINAWLYLQGKNASNASSRQYWDAPIDAASFFGPPWLTQNTNYFSSNIFKTAGASIFAQIVNSGVEAYGSKVVGSTCNYMNNCAALNFANGFSATQTVNSHSGEGWQVTGTSTGTNIGLDLYDNVGGIPYLQSWGTPSIDMTKLSGGQPALATPSNSGYCFLNSTNWVVGYTSANLDTCLTRSAAGEWALGAAGTSGDATGGIKGTWFHTTLSTAPTGSCTSGQGGYREFGADGTSAYCPTGGGTWTATSSGSGLSGMTTGQIPIAASSTTVTSSKALAGAGVGIVTGPTSSTTNDLATYADTAGTVQDSGLPATNVVTSVAPTSPINASITGHVLSVSCPTCGTSSGGTNISQNSGSTETNLPITGHMPQVCADTSGSGTTQSCTTANTFTPQTGNCLVYTTTTANSGTGLTVNVNSLGAKSVAVASASGWTTALTATSSIPANKPLNICYDGTNWDATGTGFIPSGTLIGYQTITATGAGTYTPSAGTNSVIIELVGGGGGGSGVGVGTGAQIYLGAGGAGGGWIKVRLTANFSGASYVVGAAGAGGAAGANNGGTGADTTFTTTAGSPVTYTAKGGVGGGHNGPFNAPFICGVASVTATTGGDASEAGQIGSAPITVNSANSVGGSGGASRYSNGASLVTNGSSAASVAGLNADGWGGGGSGALESGGAAAAAGGNGSNGAIIIWEYR